MCFTKLKYSTVEKLAVPTSVLPALFSLYLVAASRAREEL